ncbi:dihydrofolate reductase family protein [Chitinophaga sp. CB10]|uniref:dihydrofolate reductase family protein n=1 Tax=Chitinophaga sp. CB10 TaxID=1891659 RepID=UPI0025C2A410|nr:dihydrofolate reductase family protein [Chitinophaga sp. CB10]
MRKLIMQMSISADGFVSGPDGRADWIHKASDETSRAWAVAQCREAGLIIMGRKSFEIMAPYWPTATGPFAAPMNETPKAVFTQQGFTIPAIPAETPEQAKAAATWTGARVLTGDLATHVRQLKSEPGNPIYAAGGAGFMRNLIATGLIDEYRLIIHPLVLGAGLPIFNGLAQPLDLKLADVKAFPGGIVAHTYHV